MIKSSNETDLQGAAGINSSTIREEESKALSISSSSSKVGHTTSSSAAPWLKLKDPRIVRVSRAFGGKDRHSKVSTVRGLRDRRVRLSVPTAIQLYDLQDRLGLNQPSKVVDWLLTAAKHEIDELPPLPNIPPPAAAGPNFGLNLYHPSLLMMSSTTSHHDGQIGIHTANDEEDQKQKDHMSIEDGDDDHDHQKQQGNVDGIGSSSNIHMHHHQHQHQHQHNWVNNAISPPNYGFQHNWENHDDEQTSNFPVSHHLASHGFMTSQTSADHHHHLHNFNVLPSTLSLSTGSQTQSYFPNSSHINGTTGRSADQIDPRHDQFSHIQMLSSSLYPNSQSQQLLMRAPHFSMMHKLVQYSSHNTGNSSHDEPNKDQLESPSK